MKVKPLFEEKIRTFEDLINSPYTWDIDESFEDELLYNVFDEDLELEEAWKGKPFNNYDIIMVNHAKGPRSDMISPHRVYIVSRAKDSNGNYIYSGYQISSKVNKSNKYSRNKYNIYIDNYGTILSVGNRLPNPSFIDIGEKYTFDDNDLSANGVKKGEANKDFIDFLNKVIVKRNNGEDTSNCTWENGKGIIK